MRVGVVSYPMLFQREGGLQIQVRETISALNGYRDDHAAKLEVQLLDPNRQRLDEFDLIHVFAAINGNHRVVESADDMGVPIVLSPLLSPGWNRANGWRARLAERLTGRLTAWTVQTSYAQTKRALQLAQRVIALGAAERDAIQSAFRIDPGKICVLPNGISGHFFHADGALFRSCFSITQPFVLMVGSISPYKNQLGLVRALAGMDLPVVLIGHVQQAHQDYLRQLQREPQVRWLGSFEHGDPLLASAYAAASVLALPSQGEVFPLAVLEALATGTPVVMTEESALRLANGDFAIKLCRWDDGRRQREAIAGLLAAPPTRAAVRALVADYTWRHVAGRIAACYASVLQARREATSAV
ncbi:glycosyltransferase [Rugamonas apoptosis]|nr:glycosyltransferase [Rugamonas apoptosis]